MNTFIIVGMFIALAGIIYVEVRDYQRDKRTKDGKEI
ncbi:hypothetical protein LCGC14_0478830 [marine sediment metagenome]|uniref:Uncharacterized protein n=1 Tax=marine sediment metagenome TaxID=412755 RepID=A0A0F9SFE0_9ZZZZ